MQKTFILSWFVIFDCAYHFTNFFRCSIKNHIYHTNNVEISCLVLEVMVSIVHPCSVTCSLVDHVDYNLVSDLFDCRETQICGVVIVTGNSGVNDCNFNFTGVSRKVFSGKTSCSCDVFVDLAIYFAAYSKDVLKLVQVLNPEDKNFVISSTAHSSFHYNSDEVVVNFCLILLGI